MNASLKTLASAALAATLGVMASSAWAQEDNPDQAAMGMRHEGMPHMKDMHAMKDMQGMHKMPATVTSVDKATGMVDVTSEGMSLRLHFPPASLANLKNGDEIILHLGFSKEK